MALRDAVEAGKALKLDEMSETQQEVEAWIAAVTGKPFDAPFAERTLPAAYLPPVERGSLDVAVSRAALRRLSRVLGVRPAAAFRYSSACHMTVLE